MRGQLVVSAGPRPEQASMTDGLFLLPVSGVVAAQVIAGRKKIALTIQQRSFTHRKSI
jgi:hypothetical protein